MHQNHITKCTCTCTKANEGLGLQHAECTTAIVRYGGVTERSCDGVSWCARGISDGGLGLAWGVRGDAKIRASAHEFWAGGQARARVARSTPLCSRPGNCVRPHALCAPVQSVCRAHPAAGDGPMQAPYDACRARPTRRRRGGWGMPRNVAHDANGFAKLLLEVLTHAQHLSSRGSRAAPATPAGAAGATPLEGSHG